MRNLLFPVLIMDICKENGVLINEAANLALIESFTQESVKTILEKHKKAIQDYERARDAKNSPQGAFEMSRLKQSSINIKRIDKRM